MTLTRREVLGAVGLAAGSCALSSCAMQEKGPFRNGIAKPVYPWKYAKLDPEKTAQRAYAECLKGHCMYGVFASVMTQLAEKNGEPYRSFPVDMMRYGAGGVAGWGSLCGAVNGSSALVGLFVDDEDEIKKLVNELFLWYQQTELPQYIPQKAGLDIKVPKTVSNSVLCHVSSTKWCKVAGQKAYSNPQKERCRRLSADTAKKTVEVLNAHFASRFTPILKHDDNTKGCMSCHTAKGSEVQDSRGKMSCSSCHTSLPDGHV
jgi:hypothetical protein